jgi:predicted RNA-binding Zn-ribbon protein involved in translation (DUF1610 family)
MFSFVRPMDQIVTHDVRTHNCPVCGRPVDAGKGFICKRCGKFDICGFCVDKVAEGYVCSECLKAAGDDCVLCTEKASRAIYKCRSCVDLKRKGQVAEPARACAEHYAVLFTKRDHNKELVYLFSCPNCGDICQTCAEESRRMLGTKYRCRNCGSDVKVNESKYYYDKFTEQ